MCVKACVKVCVEVCVKVCVRVCVRVCVKVCVKLGIPIKVPHPVCQPEWKGFPNRKTSGWTQWLEGGWEGVAGHSGWTQWLNTPTPLSLGPKNSPSPRTLWQPLALPLVSEGIAFCQWCQLPAPLLLCERGSLDPVCDFAFVTSSIPCLHHTRPTVRLT